MNVAAPPPLRTPALVAGLFYLAIIVLGATDELYIRGMLVVFGDPAATARNIAASPDLWRAGIAGDLLMHLLDLPVIVFLYFLLRPVSPGLSLLAAATNVVQTAVLAANKLNLVFPLFVVGAPAYLQSFSPAQLEALSYLAIKAHQYGLAIGLAFFGFACMVRGDLIRRSGYLPAWLGILMGLAGLCYLVNSFALLAVPRLASAIVPWVFVPPLVGELAMALWLVFRGVDPDGWRRRSPG